MGKVNKPRTVKLIVGLIFKQDNVFRQAEIILERRFGKIDFEGPAIDFTHTDHYQKEIGKNLKRKFISFKELILPHSLPQIKIITNRIENKLSEQNLRLINIDPGYLDMAKVILASTKDYKHRIYLNKGIYAEIALFYQNRTFQPWEWTYPDYKSPEYIAVFNQIRQIYAEDLSNQ